MDGSGQKTSDNRILRIADAGRQDVSARASWRFGLDRLMTNMDEFAGRLWNRLHRGTAEAKFFEIL
jgi:hypothetical protein